MKKSKVIVFLFAFFLIISVLWFKKYYKLDYDPHKSSQIQSKKEEKTKNENNTDSLRQEGKNLAEKNKQTEKEVKTENNKDIKKEQNTNNREEKKKPVETTWWHPKPGLSWQWQLDGKLDISVSAQVFDIDLFDNSAQVIKALHQQGKKVICYFSAGSYENWRPDKNKFSQNVLGKKMDGWAGERWLDIRKINLLSNVIIERLDLAKKKHCDAVEPDNVDGYDNKTGFSLNYNDQLHYNRWLSQEAHKKGLAIGLKNDLEQVNDLVNYFDFAINEQCFEYKECNKLIPFIQKNKAVFGVEYSGNSKKFCKKANQMRFSWLKKKEDLKSWRISCR